MYFRFSGSGDYLFQNERSKSNKRLYLPINELVSCFILLKGPFTLTIFAAILAVIFAAISWRFHGDFKSPV